MLLPLNKLIKDFNLDIRGVLHIGAHYGEEIKEYDKAGIKNIIFFEPVKSNFAKLPSGIAAYNIALGNETGTREIYIETANNGQSCSLLEPLGHLTQYPMITFDSMETIKIDKLDNITFDRCMYNMINIDVQGFELEVFKGGVCTLETIDIIYTEVNCAEVYKGCVRVEELDEYLCDFERVVTSWAGGTWGDALYIRK